RIANAEQGVVVILRNHEEDKAMLQWMMSHFAVDESKKKERTDIRTDGVGAQILMDVGVKKMRLLSAPKVIHGLAGFGLEVVEYISGDE
ncbi:MAG: bifunctional 3,4-dihydroxy-2-butanone-4-phosphate synthase/GTP cyclohydrolase II, partial [Gammaproteobacteria bacterium]|nr:bifunctional 3,4-dihydroxy-2-butanone-4-phosphate synthase/GTP cyclohydrolase II [Gammaproteobacteria bacterium]